MHRVLSVVCRGYFRRTFECGRAFPDADIIGAKMIPHPSPPPLSLVCRDTSIPISMRALRFIDIFVEFHGTRAGTEVIIGARDRDVTFPPL